MAHDRRVSFEEVRRQFEAGQFAEVVRALRERSYSELSESPEIGLLFGISLARLGRQLEGRHWTVIALTAAQERDLHWVEARAWNACGALAMEAGELDEAQGHFLKARATAAGAGDHTTVGRCSNNLGIIASMCGDYGRAVGAYTVAIAAYQRAGFARGVAESYHNLGLAYREHGRLGDAVDAADRAASAARLLDDQGLLARALAGRAETRVALADGEAALREIERAIAIHEEWGDVVDRAEDQRVLGVALAAVGRLDDAETTLRDAVTRARRLQRPVLHAAARRDLARLLYLRGSHEEARAVALAARQQYETLGATTEVQRLEDLLTDIGCPCVAAVPA